jgi:threonine dehydrogenase-like Zn-dependent dehydrogenase
MKAIKIIDKQPVLVDAPIPKGDGVRVKVVSSSICGSDLHMMAMGYFGDLILGHEFAGITDDGRSVAIEPLQGCGQCGFCDEGYSLHCEQGFSLMGVMADGGMAEYVSVPADKLIELPSGLDISTASLIEPLAVAVHGVERARVRESDRILIIGAGPIGLAIGAVLHGRGIPYDISARYPHQQQAAEALKGHLAADGHYDVVIDAIGTASSLQQAIQHVKPMGRIGMVGMFWEPTEIEPGFWRKEAELLPAVGYYCKSPRRSFEEARNLLHRCPEIAQALITHRYPLEGFKEAFETASNRAAGAIKVVFEVGTG